MSSEVFTIVSTPEKRRGRPKTKKEKNERRQQNRAGLAVRHQVAQSLRPNEWLQEDCVEGKPNALVIRDEWQFKMPVASLVEHAPEGTRADDVLTAEEAERAASLGDYMVEAHAFGLRWASVNDTFIESDHVKDAAQEFALSIWRDLISGKYKEEGKFDHYLAVRWKHYLLTNEQKFWDERDNFKGIQTEGFSRNSGRPYGLEPGYLAEAEASTWVHRRDRAAAMLKKRTDEQIDQLSPGNRNLLALWLDLGCPTHAALAEHMGVSAKTVQRMMAAARREAARLKAAPTKGISLVASAEPDVVDLFASAAPEPERILYDRKGAAFQLSISVRALDYLIANKKLATRRIGKKVMVQRTELLRFSRSDHPEALMDAA